MRVLGIETSCASGSVALVDNGVCLQQLVHNRAGAHGESILPLIHEAMLAAGWTAQNLDRVAVGTGPGSFTGLRVGIALAVGIAESLRIEVVGVGSLQSMAASVPAAVSAPRCCLLDARRGEVFAAAYDAAGLELVAPCALPSGTAIDWIRSAIGEEFVAVGEGWELCRSATFPIDRQGSRLPSAQWTAHVGAAGDRGMPPSPCYVRNQVAVRPQLPPNPLQT